MAYIFAWDGKTESNLGPFLEFIIRALLSVVLFSLVFIKLRHSWIPLNLKHWILSIIFRTMNAIPLKDEYNQRIISFQSWFICWAIVASIFFGSLSYLQVIVAGKAILPLFLRTELSAVVFSSLVGFPISIFIFPKISKEFSLYIAQEKEKEAFFEKLAENFNATEKNLARFGGEKFIKGFTKEENIECSISAELPLEKGNEKKSVESAGSHFKILMKVPNMENFIIKNQKTRGYKKIETDNNCTFYIKGYEDSKYVVDMILGMIEKTRFLNDIELLKIEGSYLKKYNDSFVVIEKKGNIYRTEPNEIYAFIKEIIKLRQITKT